MPDRKSGKELLENAYELRTPEDNRAYYAALADSYDGDFAQGLGYDYPRAVAEAYHRHAGERDIPIADIGCGTGIVASHLGLPSGQIDGMDISPEMLTIARDKGLYRKLHTADLTADVLNLPTDYGAVLSAGTFTHGHLGPGPLRGLLQIARPGALFVIGVNRAHFGAEGFQAVLDDMVAGNAIGPVTTRDVPMYSIKDHAHSEDVATLLIYRKI